MKYKEFYYTKNDFRGMGNGTKVRVHNWNQWEVQVALYGELEWIPIDIFEFFFTDNPDDVYERS